MLYYTPHFTQILVCPPYRWRRFPDPHAFARRQDQLIQGFAAMAAKIGGGDLCRVEFPAAASDHDILQKLLASSIPALLQE